MTIVKNNCSVNYSLTSFEYPGEEVGEIAARLILDKLRNKKISTSGTTIISPVIVEGDTVKDIS